MASNILGAVLRQTIRVGRPMTRQAGGTVVRAATREREEVGVAHRLPAFVAGLGGSVWVASDKDDLAASCQAPSYGIPKSVEILAANDIPVKPQLLLDNVAWELLRDSALMRSKDKEHQKTQEEILAIRKRLETYKERNYKVDGKTAMEIAQKFGTWMSLNDLLCWSEIPEQGRAHMEQVLASMGEDAEALDQRTQKLSSLLARGMKEEARLATEAAKTHHRELCTRLMRVKNQLEKYKASRWEKAKTFVGSAAACVVVGLTCELVGFLPSAPESVLHLLRDAGMVGAVVCLSGAAATYFLDDEFNQLQKQVEENELRAKLAQLQLAEMIDQCLGI